MSEITLYGACRKWGRCLDDCGLCAHINPDQTPKYKATNQAYRYRKKQAKGDLLGPDTLGKTIDYKEPLRKVEDGFGYFGCITVDEATETLIQCHICGFYFKQLGMHLSEHTINQRSYKKKYGLSITQPLLSAEALEDWKEKRPFNYTEKHRKQLNSVRSLSTEAVKKSVLVGKDTLPLEYYNRFGICPDQVIDKYLHLKEKLYRSPSCREMCAEYNTSIPRLIMKSLNCKWSEVEEKLMEIDESIIRTVSMKQSDIDILRNRSNMKAKQLSQIEKFNLRTSKKNLQVVEN